MVRGRRNGICLFGLLRPSIPRCSTYRPVLSAHPRGSGQFIFVFGEVELLEVDLKHLEL